MGVAIVGGVFTILLAVLSWLLTNGSKRGRLLSRIERQTAVLNELPDSHAARAHLDGSLEQDAKELRQLGSPPLPPRKPGETDAERDALIQRAVQEKFARYNQSARIAATGAFAAGVATLVGSFLDGPNWK